MKKIFCFSLLASLVMMLAACGSSSNAPLTFEMYEKEGDTVTTGGAPVGIRMAIAIPQEDNEKAQGVTSAIREIMAQSQLGKETGAPKEGTLKEVVDDYVQRFLQKVWGEEYGPMQCDLFITNGFQNDACIVLHVADGLYGNGGPVEFDVVVRLSDGHIMKQEEMINISNDELQGIIEKALAEGDETPIMLEDGFFISPVAADSCKILWPTGSHFVGEVIVPLSVIEPFLTEEGKGLFSGSAAASQDPASEVAKEETAAETSAEAEKKDVAGELGLFDLQGPVKECVWVNEWGNTKRTFDEKGFWLTHNGKALTKVYPAGIKRDDKGRIISGRTDSDGNGEDYANNEFGKITKYSYHEYDSIEEDSYTYDENGNLLKGKFEPGGMDAGEPYEETYENIDVDEHGNWTKRKVKCSLGDTSTQTRKITYY